MASSSKTKTAASPYNESGQTVSELRFVFDVKKLEQYLVEKKLEGFQAPLTVKQFNMGQSNRESLCFGSYLTFPQPVEPGQTIVPGSSCQSLVEY